jgi:hypothetical protein
MALLFAPSTLALQPVPSETVAMRPSILDPLFAGAAGIKGIGSKLDKLLAAFLRPPHGMPGDRARILDLLFHLPSGLVDRRYRPRIAGLPREGVVTVEAIVAKHRPPPPMNKRLPYRVDLYDGTGMMTLVFFHAYADSLKRLLPEGETRFVSGKIEWFNDEAQMPHPDHIVTAVATDRADLSAERRYFRQGAGQGHPGGTGAGSGASGMAGCRLPATPWLAALRCGPARPAPSGNAFSPGSRLPGASAAGL